MKQYCVYILASQKHGTLYIGRAENLAKRIHDHKTSAAAGFTKKYKINQLVHYEIFENALDAATREKQLKKWKRAWKINLIEENNADWNDLYNKLNQ